MTINKTDIETELTSEHTEARPSNTEPVGSEPVIVGGLDTNVAGALTYLFGAVTGLVFDLLESENTFVRFHAVQSMIVFGGLIALSFGITFVQVALEIIPVTGWLVSRGFGLLSLLILPVGFALWHVLLTRAYEGERYRLPIGENITERHS